ncbi:MAG: Crp/Fnr family transcriptional regulator [Deltaproteobacteria bacterium]
MTYPSKQSSYSVKCANCPLRKLPLFESFSAETLRYMETFKIGELTVNPGTTLLMEGSNSPQLYTALTGMGTRYKTLENGDRQVVNFVFPGDFLGLQAGVMGEMKHSAEAVTQMTLCVFDRASLWGLFQTEPDRAFDLTWLAAMEEHFLGESLATIGQLDGRSRIAWALTRIFLRLRALQLGTKTSVPLPYRQQDLADTVGISLVHTNKTLQALKREKLADWSDGTLTIPSLALLAEIGEIDPERPLLRPLI